MRSKDWKKLSVILLVLAAFTLALVGCSGDDGANGINGAPGAPGINGAPGAPGKDANAVTVASALTAEQAAELSFQGSITGVTIASPPVVKFTVTDANGKGITGLGVTTRSATTGLVSYPNLGFTIAKLVPGTAGTPEQWVNYIVTTMPYTNTSGVAVPAAATRPTTDTNGTLVDNGDGSYTYTFARDIAKTKDVAGVTDVTYEPTLTHRLVVQVGGTVRGTYTNTADGSDSGVPRVYYKNPVNMIYDFIPATGAKVGATDLQREIVTIDKCNDCHGKLAFHGGGSRVETKYCVLCHNDQRKIGRTEATTTATGYSGSTYMIGGKAAGDFTTMVHQIHMGTRLAKTGYNYANVLYNDFNYAAVQDQGLCRKCHEKDAAAAQGDNWKEKPSRKACGACHDGIDWATGSGSTIADRLAQMSAAAGTAIAKSGHVGRAQTSDATCYLCHDSLSIEIYHLQENKTTHNPTVAAGLKNFTYEIKSAAVDATTNAVTVVFKISADGTPVTFVPAAATVTAPLAGFTGGPSFLLAYAMSQDGITTPADYNNLGQNAAQPISVSIANLLSTNLAATVGTMSATADASGYYTATIVGPSKVFPVGAKLRSVSLQGYFTQSAGGSVTVATPRHTISVVKAVTGDTVRRAVVDPAKCGKCHEWFEGHGGNRVYETQVCVVCHVPNLSSSGRGIADAALTAYVFNDADTAILTRWGFNKTLANAALNFPEATNNFKDMIHGIHAGKDRTDPLHFTRDRLPGAIMPFDVYKVGFPGILDNCQTCHLPNTTTVGYNVVPATALWTNNKTTTGADTTTAIAKAARVGSVNAGTFPNATDRVTSPFTAACVSCHDSAAAKSHMQLNNGQIDILRSSIPTAPAEACAVCHGAGKEFDPVKVHN